MRDSIVTVLQALLACLAVGTVGAAAERPPNMIVIMADDVGWGDLSCYGATAVRTPHIDRLAREGLRFTSGYASASTCTPTRYSFLTGEYAFRRPGTGVAPPNAPAIIQPGTPTLPAVLRTAGYRTAVVGKWHLGLGDRGTGPDWNGMLRPGPLEVGFDHCLILPTTNDRVPQVLVEDHRVRGLDPADPLWVGDTKPSADHVNGVDNRDQLKLDWSHGHNGTIHNGIGRIGFYTGGTAARFRDEDLADIWARESSRWIEADQDKPFFLFLASQDIHVPRIAHERFQGATSLGPRGDCIVQLDWVVGQVLEALERAGHGRDTLVVFCSDNGPVLDDGYKDDAVEKLGDHTPSGPFRGGKYSVYEGGTRTPFIAWWPGRIAAGTSGAIISTIDLPASLAAVAAATVPAGAFPDSVDLHGAVLGAADARGRDAVLQQDNGSGSYGYREGRWKLVRARAGQRAKTTTEALYDLDDDQGERIDVAERHPDVVSRLRAALDRLVSR